MERDKLVSFLDEYLKCGEFADYCPNGLQVEGRNEIQKVVTSVTASVALFEQAITKNADAVIVHHGIILNSLRPLYQGGYRERVRLLLTNDINLFAYHLPLDAHPELGNNALLCRELNLTDARPFGSVKGQYIGMTGLAGNIEKNVFFSRIETVVDRKPVIFPYGPDRINKVGIISGGADREISQAVSAGCDAFVTGEVSEHIMHYAQEEKIHFISAGHYATERFGIRELGNMLQKKFNLEVTYIDIPNPV